MAAWDRLKESLDAFEQIQVDFGRNSDQQDPNWRRNIVDLRRKLQDSLIHIREALQAFENGPGSSDACQTLSTALSSMRTAIALHQAQWPAVAIDTADASYRASVRELRAATKDFREAARATVAALRP